MWRRCFHENVRPLIESGEKVERKARDEYSKASDYLSDGLHLQAQRKAAQAKENANEALKFYQRALRACADLDQEKATYERKLREMEALRSRAEQKVRQYGGSTSRMAAFQAPMRRGNEVLDYAVMLGMLNAQETAWNAHAAAARHAWEVAEAARRAEAARIERARRAREEEERRRSDSYSSSWSGGSSSGGSSWGGGGSDSSGGSFGGGGSDSSGGDW